MRTNRVEPVNTGNDAGDIQQGTVTTTTRLEFVRRVQVVPMVSKYEYSILSREFNCRMSIKICLFYLLILIDHGKREQSVIKLTRNGTNNVFFKGFILFHHRKKQLLNYIRI
jgi:hypothetical protein